MWQQAVDVADLKHLVAASDWGHRPVSWGYLMPPPSMASFANRIANDRLPLREKAPAPSKPNGEPAQPDTPEKQDIAVKNNGKNQADAKKDAKEKSASDSRVSARVSPHRSWALDPLNALAVAGLVMNAHDEVLQPRPQFERHHNKTRLTLEQRRV
jgi:hypothetical protein